MYCLFCIVPCIVCVYICTVLLPPVGYQISVKYIISYHTIFSPISRSTELCGFEACITRLTIHIVQFQFIQDTSRQQLGWTLPDTVNTVECSCWWAKISPETCRADLE